MTAVQKTNLNRVVTCDSEAIIAHMAGENNADRVILVYDSASYGGASSSTAMVSVGLPTNGAIHELMHTFGFADDYMYASACEADTYCPRWKSTPNSTIFQDSPPYPSDAVARARHSSQIPWFAQILPTTLITTGSQLGTPVRGAIGLYPGKQCIYSSDHLKIWSPGDLPTVMETLNVSYIPKSYWPAVAEGLHTRILSAESGTDQNNGSNQQAAPAAKN